MTTFSGEVHALAARWPLMPDDELDALAASIAADGLQHPIVIDNQGRLVDGRNRLEACHRAKVSPTYVTPADLNDDESVRRWIHRANGQRRNVSTGQKAMEYADLLASEGKRKNGRWVRGSVVTDVRNTGDRTWIDAMRQAGLVLDYRPDLVDPVIRGAVTLNAAAVEAEQVRDAQRRAHVRVMNGDWTRAVGTGAAHPLAVRQGKGPAGVLLDPPYDADTADSYRDGLDDRGVAAAAARWAVSVGGNKLWRIVACGYDGDNVHDIYTDAGWTTIAWHTDGYLTGGYGNQSHRELLYASPHCLPLDGATQPDLFAEVAP